MFKFHDTSEQLFSRKSAHQCFVIDQQTSPTVALAGSTPRKLTWKINVGAHKFSRSEQLTSMGLLQKQARSSSDDVKAFLERRDATVGMASIRGGIRQLYPCESHTTIQPVIFSATKFLFLRLCVCASDVF